MTDSTPCPQCLGYGYGRTEYQPERTDARTGRVTPAQEVAVFGYPCPACGSTGPGSRLLGVRYTDETAEQAEARGMPLGFWEK